MKVISLLTDFGQGSGYVGMMKGVILSIAPQINIVDLSHEISPQNVLEGALLLGRSTPFFPHDSIHVAVVDPGVGTERGILAARCGPQWFVGPDNGLVTLMLARAEQNEWSLGFVKADKPEYWLPEISNVFHGRDIFAPLAAHLANGVALSEIGTPIDDPVRLKIPQPEVIGPSWKAQVMSIDRFGNLATNLRAEDFLRMGEIIVQIGDVSIQGLSETYGDKPSGSLVALINSEGYLEIALVNGSAALYLKAATNDPIVVLPINRYA